MASELKPGDEIRINGQRYKIERQAGGPAFRINPIFGKPPESVVLAVGVGKQEFSDDLFAVAHPKGHPSFSLLSPIWPQCDVMPRTEFAFKCGDPTFVKEQVTEPRPTSDEVESYINAMRFTDYHDEESRVAIKAFVRGYGTWLRESGNCPATGRVVADEPDGLRDCLLSIKDAIDCDSFDAAREQVDKALALLPTPREAEEVAEATLDHFGLTLDTAPAWLLCARGSYETWAFDPDLRNITLPSNEQLKKKGVKVVGFRNPLLYEKYIDQLSGQVETCHLPNRETERDIANGKRLIVADADKAPADDELTALREAFEPIKDWYDADGDRTDFPAMLREAVEDLVEERRASLKRRAPRSVSINKAVERFLAWELPRDFDPDCGAKFDPYEIVDPQNNWPTGTNLLTATQAKAMFEHCLQGEAPASDDTAARVERLWIDKRLFIEPTSRVDGNWSIVSWDKVRDPQIYADGYSTCLDALTAAEAAKEADDE